MSDPTPPAPCFECGSTERIGEACAPCNPELAEADGLEVVGRRVRASDEGYAFEPLVLKSAADARISELQAEIERLRGLMEEAREAFNVILLQSEDCLSVRDEIITEHASRTLSKIGEPR